MEAGLDFCPAEYGCAMAQSWIQSVLDLAIAASKSVWQEVREQGIARTDLSHGRGESDMGRAADSWRIEDARFRYLGKICAAMDAEGTKES